MRNRLKQLMHSEGNPVGAQLRFGSPAIAELFGHAGFDWLVIDCEHAPQTPVGVQSQLQAIGNTPATPIVRIPKVDEQQIRLYLDMGAMGILAAFVQTPGEAELGAAACRYPPRGIRGWGPHRAARYGLNAEQYTREINDEVTFIALIESSLAIENIDAILAVDGVDTAVLGPVDLSISLGVPFDFKCAAFADAEAKVVAAARRIGKPVMGTVYGDQLAPSALTDTLERGYAGLLLGGDEFLMTSGCKTLMANVAEIRR